MHFTSRKKMSKKCKKNKLQIMINFWFQKCDINQHSPGVTHFVPGWLPKSDQNLIKKWRRGAGNLLRMAWFYQVFWWQWIVWVWYKCGKFLEIPWQFYGFFIEISKDFFIEKFNRNSRRNSSFFRIDFFIEISSNLLWNLLSNFHWNFLWKNCVSESNVIHEKS
jgi:hypothetical protein